MRIDVLTLFPELFPGPLAASLVGQALAAGRWQLAAHDLRAQAGNRHGRVDDTPFGGGAGMVLRPDVVDAAVRAVAGYATARRIYLSPRGRRLDQALLAELAALPHWLLLCGRYEGVDERVLEAQQFEEISIGDYVLPGGELPAMVLIEGAVRLLPGVVGCADSLCHDSLAAGLLEYPQYTRPAEWQGRPVPPVLVSGHHEQVRAWRQAMAETLTQTRRPDLWAAWLAGKQKPAGQGR